MTIEEGMNAIIIFVVTFWLLLIVLNCYIDAIQDDFEKNIYKNS